MQKTLQEKVDSYQKGEQRRKEAQKRHKDKLRQDAETIRHIKGQKMAFKREVERLKKENRRLEKALAAVGGGTSQPM